MNEVTKNKKQNTTDILERERDREWVGAGCHFAISDIFAPG